MRNKQEVGKLGKKRCGEMGTQKARKYGARRGKHGYKAGVADGSLTAKKTRRREFDRKIRDGSKKNALRECVKVTERFSTEEEWVGTKRRAKNRFDAM